MNQWSSQQTSNYDRDKFDLTAHSRQIISAGQLRAGIAIILTQGAEKHILVR